MAFPSLPTQIKTMGDLKKALALWADRDDPEFLDQCHNFINFAEKDIYRRLRIPSLEREIYLNIYHGTCFIPADIIEIRHVLDTCTGSVYRHTSLEEIQWIRQNKRVNETSFNVDETCFCRIGGRLLFSRDFDAVSDGLVNGQVIMNYISDTPELVDDDSSANILTIAPDLVLYMALKHACLFVQDDNGAQKWGMLAESALALIQEQANKMEYSGSPKVIPNSLDNYTNRNYIRFGVIR
jgi:hypothetical protein